MLTPCTICDQMIDVETDRPEIRVLLTSDTEAQS